MTVPTPSSAYIRREKEEYALKGADSFVCNFRLVRCSETLSIGRGCLHHLGECESWMCEDDDTHNEMESPEVVLDGSTTGSSSLSVSIAEELILGAFERRVGFEMVGGG